MISLIGSRQKSEKDLVKDLKGTLFHILSTKTGSTASEANATTKEEEHKPNVSGRHTLSFVLSSLSNVKPSLIVISMQRLQREKEAKSKSGRNGKTTAC